MILQCACCGGNAPARKHWWTRDQGYGVCSRCFAEDLKKVGPELAEQYYGKAGIHHSIDVPIEALEVKNLPLTF